MTTAENDTVENIEYYDSSVDIIGLLNEEEYDEQQILYSTRPEISLESTIPDTVRGFITYFHNAIFQNNIYELHNCYENLYSKLSEQYYKNTSWPDAETISPLVNDDSNFIIFYRELYFRHIYAKLQPTIEQRFQSYDNYCDLFNFILNSEVPVNLELPSHWAWDIVDEFIYQFQAFCNYKNRLSKRSEDEIHELRENPQIWSTYSVLNVLYSLIQKSKINEQLIEIKNGRDPNKVAGEFGSQNLYRMLGYFSIIGLLRVHCLLGDFTLALKTMDNIGLNKKGFFGWGGNLTLTFTAYYYVGFSYMMLHRYIDAIKAFSHVLFISRTKLYQNRSVQYDHITKKGDQMYALLAMCIALCPIRIDDNLHILLKEKYGEELLKMQRGGPECIPVFTELFSYACPKFISPLSPDFDNALTTVSEHQQHHLKIFISNVENQMMLPALKSYLKLYTTMHLDKIASYLEITPENLRTLLFVYKQKSKQIRWSEGSLLSGEVINISDIEFAIEGNIIHIAEVKTARRYAEYFMRNEEISELSVKYTFSILRFLLSPYYFIQKVDKKLLEQDNWEKHAALIVMPGSKHVLYKTGLNETINKKVSEYLKNGGKYLGIVAGAYYASNKNEFQFENDSENYSKQKGLSIFPGVIRGPIFSEFAYHKNTDPQLTPIQIEDMSFKNLEYLYLYHCGGALFINADQFSNTRILATYKEANINYNSGPKAAIIHCKIGKGEAVLFGVHPEYSILSIGLKNKNRNYSDFFNKSLQLENQRITFLRHILQLLGLQTTFKPIMFTNLTDLHLSSKFPSIIKEAASLLYSISENINEESIIKCETDIFYLQESSSISAYGSIENFLNNFYECDYNRIPKYIKIHEYLPTITETPFFNHKNYFENLLASRTLKKHNYQLGNIILYGETLTSSQTLLKKNLKLLKVLPTGLVFVATQQTAGKGRQNNTWISPLGTLAYSLVIKHSEYSEQSSVIFIQYLVSLAVVEAIKTYDIYYDELDIRIKWPNDICIRKSEDDTTEPSFILNNISYIKIGGILINCNYIDNEFLMIIGCGINITNFFPTSLEMIIKKLNSERINKQLPLLKKITQEKILARIMTILENMYYELSSSIFGFKLFEQQYYKYWLHTDQIITLENVEDKVIITGINTTHGCLIAESIENGKKNGKIWELHPDLNSFDMMKRLIKKKVT
ncbi:hypothetical protein PCK1_001432 [Pneumocystis canis]|nr:hypothetical protein PCK1_001432 [Pneumocystis canis]